MKQCNLFILFITSLISISIRADVLEKIRLKPIVTITDSAFMKTINQIIYNEVYFDDGYGAAFHHLPKSTDGTLIYKYINHQKIVKKYDLIAEAKVFGDIRYKGFRQGTVHCDITLIEAENTWQLENKFDSVECEIEYDSID